MIPTRLSGNSKLLISLGVLMICQSACRTVRLSNKGKIRRDNMTVYTNETYNVTVDLFGDYRFNKSKRVKGLKEIFWQSPLLPNRSIALLYAKTTDAPYFDCLVLLTSKQSRDHYFKNGYELISKNDDTIYRHIDPISIKEEMIDQYVVPLNNYDLGILAYASTSQNKGYSNAQLLTICREEFSQIAMSAKNDISGDRIILNPFSMADSAFLTAPDGNYLLPIAKLKERHDTFLSIESSVDQYYQALATYLSFIGEYKDEFKNISKWMKSDSGDVKSIDMDGKKLYPVDSVLSEVYVANQIVMFNESHFEPKHRLFVAKQLSHLRSAGFKYLALEALSTDDSSINVRRFPTLLSGFYAREYNMANLIRTALALGFTVIGYDDINNSGQQREEHQARQIYRKTIGKDRKAKVAVLAGHSHINESGSSAWMAQHFQKISHINPATINQTTFSQNELLHINTGATTSSILLKHDFPGQADINANDYYIVNKDQREAEIYLGADRQYSSIVIQVPDNLVPNDTEKVLLIYLKQEMESCKDPLPCFTRKVECGQKVSVRIPTGNYVVRVKDTGNYVLYQNDLSLK